MYPIQRELNTSGKALLEFALALPFLMLLALGAVEGVKYCRYEEILSTISREAGRAAFNCSFLNVDEAGMNNCLVTVIEGTPPLWNGGALPPNAQGVPSNASFRVSIWEFTAAGAPANFRGQYLRGTPPPSRFTSATVATLKSYTEVRRRIVTVEASISVPSMLGFFDGNYSSITIS